MPAAALAAGPNTVRTARKSCPGQARNTGCRRADELSKPLIRLGPRSFRKLSALDQDFPAPGSHSVARGRSCWGADATQTIGTGRSSLLAGSRWPGQDGQRNQGSILNFERGERLPFAREECSELGRDAGSFIPFGDLGRRHIGRGHRFHRLGRPRPWGLSPSPRGSHWTDGLARLAPRLRRP
jgi:hypothetical protein